MKFFERFIFLSVLLNTFYLHGHCFPLILQAKRVKKIWSSHSISCVSTVALIG